MKNFYLYIGFYIALTSSCKQAEKTTISAEERLNILWIVSEDNSPWLGCYGDSIATTPHLDRLASKGILFTNAYSNAPVCAPSRNSLITGMYSPALGTQHMRSTYKIPDSIQFYPKLLKEAGYYTSNNVKKDYNTTDQPEVWSESSKTATYKNRPEGQPFFAIFNLHDTHESRLHRDSIPRNHRLEDIKLYPYHPDTPEMRSDYAVYYDRLQDLDTKVGKILDELEKEGLSENTIIFYYSDHGGAVAGTKRFATQQGLHVPLIVRVPEKFKHVTKYKQGDKVDRPVSFIDFPPTLFKLIGEDIPEQFQGTPFLNPENDNNLVFGFAGRMDERINMVRTVTDGRYRYIRNYLPNRSYGAHIQTLWKAKGMQSWYKTYLEGKTNKEQSTFFIPRPFEELYDLTKDPYQLKNLANNSSFFYVKSKLSEALRNWQVENRDAGFIPEAMLQELNKNQLVYEYTHSEAYPIEKLINLTETFYKKNEVDQNELIKNFESKNPLIRLWAVQALLFTDKLNSKTLATLKKLLYNEPSYVGITIAEVLFRNNEYEYAINYLQKQLNSDQLIVRVQVLNTISLLNKVGNEMIPRLQQLAEQRNGKKLPYDARLATHILKTKSL
ncbi:sulfatase-like hydrolase/transferase [Aquimarina celericrescens]|uniref:Sulfatase-like hydrolase/transferase n=1 Tax=Aquimarina celericrescens TaxID=1964542 RepID=A0ABW5AZ31_9FLAO|nr:sulfatase [Aquimarina celericrescens]